MTWSKLRDELRGFSSDLRGAVLVYVTVGIGVFMGFSALAIDGSYLFLMKNRAQSAADSAVLAAASQLPNQVAAEMEATAFAAKNLSASDYGNVLVASDVDFGDWDSSTRTFTEGTSPAEAVRVTVRMSNDNANPLQLFFANAMGYSDAGVVAEAIATYGGGIGQACLQALNPDLESSFAVVGTVLIDAAGCNIQVDSCHDSNAFDADGSTDIDLTVILNSGSTGSGGIYVCGGLTASSNVTLPPNSYVHDLTGVRQGDPFDVPPFDSLPSPSEYSPCDETAFSATGNITMSPGVYCNGLTLSGNGTATFQPGTYYIKDGEFLTEGNRTLIANGVTFVFTGADANINLGGTAAMALSAPTTGDYAGFVFFGDPDHPATSPHILRGTALDGFHGIGYFPNAEAEFVGTSDTAGSGATGTDDCAMFVADTLDFDGTIELALSTECSDYQGAPSLNGSGPLSYRLVD